MSVLAQCRRTVLSAPLEVRSLTSLILGVFVFGLGLLSIGAWHFEQKDF